jgi:hypothetical protein
METQFEPLVLEKFRDLLLTRTAYQSFKGKLTASLRSGFSPILAEGQILGLAVSTENGKELIYERVADQWARNPSFLDQLRQSLESEDLVEAHELEETADRPKK